MAKTLTFLVRAEKCPLETNLICCLTPLTPPPFHPIYTFPTNLSMLFTILFIDARQEIHK